MTKAEINEMKLTSAQTLSRATRCVHPSAPPRSGVVHGRSADVSVSTYVGTRHQGTTKEEIWQIFTRHSAATPSAQVARSIAGETSIVFRCPIPASSTTRPQTPRGRGDVWPFQFGNPIAWQTSWASGYIVRCRYDDEAAGTRPLGGIKRRRRLSISRANAANHCEGRRRGCRHLTGESRRSRVSPTLCHLITRKSGTRSWAEPRCQQSILWLPRCDHRPLHASRYATPGRRAGYALRDIGPFPGGVI